MILRNLLLTLCLSAGFVHAAPLHMIGDLQGRVENEDNSQEHHTPINGKVVRVQGVVHTPTLSRNRNGLGFYGFFIQNRVSQADGDPLTSDAVFVDIGQIAGLEYGEERFFPVSGDELMIEGTVAEHFNLTSLQKAKLIKVIGKRGEVEGLEEGEVANPPDAVLEADLYWERREGMLMSIDSGAIVSSARKVFESSQDSEIWLIAPSHPVALRENPYAQRVFRDAHPLDDVSPDLEDNGNGFRMLIGATGIKAKAQNSNGLLPSVRTFDRLENTLQGAVIHAFGKYAIHPEKMPAFSRGPDPSKNSTADRVEGADRVVVYNLENLFDYRDDPHDQNDFAGNTGANGVRKPFDYVPGSDAEYQSRLERFAQQIVRDLESPDVLILQEIEDQDIGGMVDGLFVIHPRREGNGQLDVLEELSLAIREAGGPEYVPAADREGADYRGIICAYLFRKDSYQLDVNFSDSSLLAANPSLPSAFDWKGSFEDGENPRAFNGAKEGLKNREVMSRGLQVLKLRSVRNSDQAPVYLMNCHLSSGPGRSIERRTAQATLIATLCELLMEQDPEARILAGGDYNVFPRPDEPVVGEPSDQLRAIYEAGMSNAYDRLLKTNPQSAYTYVYKGQAGALDQLFYSPALSPKIKKVEVLHVNSDWTENDPEFPLRAVSDHDPVIVDILFE